MEEYQTGGFTISMFNDLVKKMDKDRPSEIRIPVSMHTMITLDISCVIAFHKIKGRFFHTETRKAYDYIELTPYNKGNLWKIRCFHHHFRVYYGTQNRAYCTTLQDCLKLIPKS